VAISYTYGNYTQPNISAEDFTRLQTPFALDSLEFSRYVSPIIRHAIHLTSSIDERYLWADALCVTHHDPEAASEQLAAMGTIYASAIVTIIATDGDSMSGITGLKGTSDSRGISQDVIPFGDETLIVRWGSRRNNEKCQFYFERGWTFQEYELSRRKIFLADYKIRWSCACSIWHEDSTLFSELDRKFSHDWDILMAGFPDDRRLSLYVMKYNRRSLTFEEDALAAISGLLSVFSRSFEGGFLYGIPEMFFEHSLGWRHPWWLEEGLRHRVTSGRPAENRFAFSGLPSWSWLGWKGRVSLRYQTAIQIRSHRLEYAFPGECRNQIEEAFPITEWYTSESISDPPERRRRIQSTWYKDRDSLKDFTKPMPFGWSRRDIGTATSSQSDPRPRPDGCEKFVFQHEAISEMDGIPVERYYPFPVNEITASTPPSMPVQTQYLFCETFQATLSGYQQDINKSKYPYHYEAKLCNELGKVVGKLDLVNEESMDQLSQVVDTTTEIGLEVDVVAICKLKRYTKKDSDSPQTTKDLYLILWVEWKDGIAYRLSSGEVVASEWEKLDLKKISLVLG
jgi:hypothetical protein